MVCMNEILDNLYLGGIAGMFDPAELRKQVCVCVCVCVSERERERVCVCVCVCVIERER